MKGKTYIKKEDAQVEFIVTDVINGEVHCHEKGYFNHKVFPMKLFNERFVEKVQEVVGGNLYNGDFTKYYDKNQKRNIWALGYFGGGSINVCDAMAVAQDYAKANGVPLDTVKIDEVLTSRRFKGFKFVYSQDEQKPETGAEQMDNVYQWLTD